MIGLGASPLMRVSSSSAPPVPLPTSWTASTTTGNTNNLFDAAYGAGRFVVSGINNTIRNSTTALTWSNSSGATGSINGVCFFKGAFIAGATSGSGFRSTDGVTFTSASIPGPTLHVSASDDIACGAGTGDKVWYTLNGTSFSSITKPNAGTSECIFVDQDDGNIWYGTSGANGGMYRTGDLSTWSNPSNPITGATAFIGIAKQGGIYVAVDSSGAVYRSTDSGLSLNATGTVLSYVPRKLRLLGGLLIGGSIDGRVVFSYDSGLSWTTVNTGIPQVMGGVAFSGTRFIVAGNGGRIAWSDPV